MSEKFREIDEIFQEAGFPIIRPVGKQKLPRRYTPGFHPVLSQREINALVDSFRIDNLDDSSTKHQISPLAARINYQITRARFLEGAIRRDYPEVPEEQQVLYHPKAKIDPSRVNSYILDLPEIIEDATVCNKDAADQYSFPIESLDPQDEMLLNPDPKYDWIRDIFDPKNDPGHGCLYPMFRRESDGRVRGQKYPHLEYRNRTGIR